MNKTRTISGNTSNWDDDYDLLLANETNGSRPWLGTYDLVAIFDRALTPTEATQNHNAGPSGQPAVGGAPVAIDDSSGTDEDSVLSGDVLVDNGSGADSDPDGDALTVSAVDGAAGSVGVPVVLLSGARVTVEADGSFVYDPIGVFDHLASGESATDSFAYTITDSNGGFGSAVVSVDVSGVNDAPAWADIGTVSVGEETSADIAVSASDTEGDGLTLSLNGASPGFVSFVDGGDGTGTITIAPAVGDEGSYSVAVVATDDGSPAKSTNTSFTVTVTANEPSGRVSDGLLALYEFGEGSGSVVSDSSGVGAPLDLVIDDVGDVSWNSGSLTVDAPDQRE